MSERYSLEPLLEFTQGSQLLLSKITGYSTSRVSQAARSGLTLHTAIQWARRLGLPPHFVWPGDFEGVHDCPEGKHRHPSWGCYAKHGCRCEGCSAIRKARYHEEVEYHRSIGRAANGARHVTVESAGPRALVLTLLERGLTLKWMAEQAGMPVSTLKYIKAGRSKRMFPHNARAIEDLYRGIAEGRIPVPKEARPRDMCQRCWARPRDGRHRQCRTCSREVSAQRVQKRRDAA